MPALLRGRSGEAALADKVYDGDALRADIADMRVKAVVSSNRSRKVAVPHDATVRKQGNRMRRCFGCLEHFRHSANRYDRRTFHFIGFVHPRAALIWLR